ncbi:MAG TPA: hypothetical protein VD835_13350 [Pyrinomonadaceae bacterium]|nr:hypothetical protein [Pyrinomonadaceae bacterium]
MISLVLLAVLTVVMFAMFVKFRQSRGKRCWTELNSSERLTLSVALAAAIQFLFFTMIPGWIVAAIVIGKGRFAETRLGNEVWGIVMMLANTVFYLAIFYLLLGWLHNWHKRKMGESDLDLISISNVPRSPAEEK